MNYSIHALFWEEMTIEFVLKIAKAKGRDPIQWAIKLSGQAIEAEKSDELRSISKKIATLTIGSAGLGWAEAPIFAQPLISISNAKHYFKTRGSRSEWYDYVKTIPFGVILTIKEEFRIIVPFLTLHKNSLDSPQTK